LEQLINEGEPTSTSREKSSEEGSRQNFEGVKKTKEDKIMSTLKTSEPEKQQLVLFNNASKVPCNEQPLESNMGGRKRKMTKTSSGMQRSGGAVATRIQMLEQGKNMQLTLPNRKLPAEEESSLGALSELDSSEAEGSKKQKMEIFTFNALSARAASVEQPCREP
jgi:hypothetical protein